MSRVRIIGIGSPFGSDQFGWKLIDHLTRSAIVPQDSATEIELESVDRPGVGLLSCLDNIDSAILIDALLPSDDKQIKLNTIVRLDKQDLLKQDTTLSTHSIGVAEALNLGGKLDLLPDKLVLIGYYAKPDEPVTQQVLEQAADLVRQELNFQ